MRDWSLLDVHTERSDEVHHLGHQVENLGDVDGDGVDDLLCATDNSQGGAEGRAFIFSGMTQKKLFEIRRRGAEVVLMPP
jgi:hypothetical protein